jgi:hypothetical protein
MLGAQGLWAGRDLYGVTPAVTWGLGFSCLIQRIAPRGCGESIHTRILTGPLNLSCTYKIYTNKSNHSMRRKIVAPPDPRGPRCEQFWIYIISGSFHVNMTYSGSLVLEKIFKWPHPIFALLWLSPLWRGSGPLFAQFRIPFTQGWFMPSLIEIGQLVLEKKIFKNFQCIFTLLWLSPLGEGQSPSFE